MTKKRYKSYLPDWFFDRALEFYYRMHEDKGIDNILHEKNKTCIYCGKKATTKNRRDEPTCKTHMQLADPKRIDKLRGVIKTDIKWLRYRCKKNKKKQPKWCRKMSPSVKCFGNRNKCGNVEIVKHCSKRE